MVAFRHIRQWFIPHTEKEKAPIQALRYTRDDWLNRFHTCVAGQGIKLILLYGTCLGIVRDQQIIDGDTDADFGVYLTDLAALRACVPALLDAGFYISGRGVFQLTFSMPNTNFYIDIWPIKALGFPHRLGGYRWLCDHVYYKADYFNHLAIRSYQNREYYVPNPCEAYLEMVFGPDWRTPIPGRYAGPRGLVSQWLNKLLVDFPVPAQFSGEDSLGTYKPWVSRVLKTVCPRSRIAQLFKHPVNV